MKNGRLEMDWERIDRELLKSFAGGCQQSGTRRTHRAVHYARHSGTTIWFADHSELEQIVNLMGG
jgi:hypothetical protein